MGAPGPGGQRSTLRGVVLALIAAAFVGASAFFVYYTIRLVYINAAGLVPPARRESGMYIGAVVFPLASLAFGYLAVRCGKAAARALHGPVQTGARR